jgi:hypothetical protein
MLGSGIVPLVWALLSAVVALVAWGTRNEVGSQVAEVA